MARFQLLDDQIEAARQLLGLEAPVSVWVGTYSWCDGRYIAFRESGHRIGLDGRISVRQANRTLWHELVHARQVEECGDLASFDREWDRQLLAEGVTRKQVRSQRIPGRRYRRAPFEREAEQLAKRYAREGRMLVRKTARGRRRRG